MLPALPTGMQWTSGASPSTSTISKAPVFWPSIRYGLTELTTVTGARSGSSRTMASAWSKLPRTCSTRAPWTSAWASLPEGDVPLGDEHGAGQAGPGGVGGGRRRGVAGRGADHRLGPLLHAPWRWPWSCPRSLNEPVGLAPSTLSHTAAADPFGQPRGRHQRRAALEQGDHRGLRLDRQEVAVLLDHPPPARPARSAPVGSWSSARRPAAPRRPGRPRRAAAGRRWSPARRPRRAAWVRKISRASSPRPVLLHGPDRDRRGRRRPAATAASTPGRSTTSRLR